MDSKQRILITGGTGYVGSNVMKYLKVLGFEVENLERSYYNERTIKLKFESFKPEIVLHFATYFSNGDSYSNMLNFKDSNISFGMDVAYYCSTFNIKKFVNFTTFQLHYNDEVYNPVNLYSATKKAFMDILKYYHESKKFEVVNVELNSVYGPWDRRPKLIPILLRLIKTQSFLEIRSLTSPDKVVDLVHIDFVCKCILNIINNTIKSDYIFICGQWTSMKELVEIIENISQEKLNVEFNSVKKINRELMEPPSISGRECVLIDNININWYLKTIIEEEQYYASIS